MEILKSSGTNRMITSKISLLDINTTVIKPWKVQADSGGKHELNCN